MFFFSSRRRHTRCSRDWSSDVCSSDLEWTLDPEVREYLVDLYGEDGLPFNSRFGNGDPIGADVVELINDVYEANSARDRKSTRLNSSHGYISYAVFCLKKKKQKNREYT